MSINWGDINGVITLLMMALFIGIWIWAWRRKHKRVFDRMAALPMEDDRDDTNTQDTKGNRHD
jgi:cytochrome c oxidase cbb3-type subunit 4